MIAIGTLLAPQWTAGSGTPRARAQTAPQPLSLMGKGKPIFVDLGSVNVGAGNTAGGWSAQDGELGLAAAQPHGYEEL